MIAADDAPLTIIEQASAVATTAPRPYFFSFFLGGTAYAEF